MALLYHKWWLPWKVGSLWPSTPSCDNLSWQISHNLSVHIKSLTTASGSRLFGSGKSVGFLPGNTRFESHDRRELFYSYVSFLCYDFHVVRAPAARDVSLPQFVINSKLVDQDQMHRFMIMEYFVFQHSSWSNIYHGVVIDASVTIMSDDILFHDKTLLSTEIYLFYNRFWRRAKLPYDITWADINTFMIDMPIGYWLLIKGPTSKNNDEPWYNNIEMLLGATGAQQTNKAYWHDVLEQSCVGGGSPLLRLVPPSYLGKTYSK